MPLLTLNIKKQSDLELLVALANRLKVENSVSEFSEDNTAYLDITNGNQLSVTKFRERIVASENSGTMSWESFKLKQNQWKKDRTE